jgi:hypothetical protein
MEFTRRELLKAASTCGLVVAALAAAKEIAQPALAQGQTSHQAQIKKEKCYTEFWGARANKFLLLVWGGITSDDQKRARRNPTTYIVAIDRGINFMDNSWITTRAVAKSAWVRRCRARTEIKSF